MPNVFNSVKGMHPKRNSFSAHTYRNDFTSQLGVNIPVYIQHVVPATKVKLATSALVRLQALIAPVMDNIDYYVHFWKIPYRLLEGDLFTQFISGEIDPSSYEALFSTPEELLNDIILYAKASDVDEYEIDDFVSSIIGNGSLFDFLGYDKGLLNYTGIVTSGDTWYVLGANDKVNLNYRGLVAYYMLHLNWYMNENVPYFNKFKEYVENIIDNDSGLANLAKLLVYSMQTFGTTLLPHGWEKDYFTSALPNVQFGSPVTIGLTSGTAPVEVNQVKGNVFSLDATDVQAIEARIQGLISAEDDTLLEINNSSEQASSIGNLQDAANSSPVLSIRAGAITGSLKGTADLSEVNVITINELRFANALQLFKERQMRFGRRRQEYYKGFFDVSPEDLRLQVPKYLGGGRIPINISDIEQTSKTDGTAALGHLAGKATAVAGGFAGFQTFCSEESIIIGIAFAMPHITYGNCVSKFLLKTNDIYDYFNPSFEHLGEQAIKKIEVYSGAGANSNDDFGYTPRYNEYRFHMNEMHGEFKSSLSYWTLGRIFSSQPALNANFVYMQPSVFDRIFAVSGQPSMLVSMLFRVRIIQPVSKYGTPMLLS